ncbi:type VI secretion system baseplate subunit TssG [Diaphorobacter caeni]|uniref:type VI secretion system baseplate subunit TssG n=1 Tax=Diaphorobacter caeni TaxID=2784387 RepID=UPI00189002A7|nr:type VI secretion system baseplate subunit TssG [Diaphorobacter caeni]MBF5004454.1 type VI secretion system baseplate subunit TssG [Diaphorobacter caeni]
MESSATHFPHPSGNASSASALSQLVRTTLPQTEAIDLFALLRHLDAASPSARLGASQTPREDVVRLGQQPSTVFAPSTLYSVQPTGHGGRPLVRIFSFGVFGPNGALPIHLTEYVRERLHNHGDPAPADFVDLFHHRFISLFYRAWADAQSVVQLDRPGVDKFSFYAGALVGLGFENSWQRDSIEDSAKLYAAGHLARLTRNPEGLEKLIGHYFGTQAAITEFLKSWIHIDVADQTRLGGMGQNNQLGVSAIAGSRLQDVQAKFRITLGPMELRKYESFLPPEANNRKLRDWVRNYIGIEMDWDVELQLRADEVPRTSLGGGSRLGWTTWMGKRASDAPANDLRLDPERDSRRLKAG